MAEAGISNNKLESMVIQNVQDISEIKAEIASIDRRIDENDQLTKGIHQLAENVATMSVEIKMLTEKFDNSIERIEHGLQKQSERITAIEKEPSKKWDKFIWLIIAAAVSAAVSYVAGGLRQHRTTR